MITKKIIALSLLLIGFSISPALCDDVNKYTQSISVQFGINGSLNDAKSYGLNFLPPDLSYSHELYDDDFFNISTATFYDNIGVKVQDTNFSYRVGQRIDFGVELEKYTPYITTGFGTMRNAHHYQTSLVYGTGFLIRIAERYLWANEINFQNVHYQNSQQDIVNISTGITYAF
ncbi:MAG: hypothetical protein EBS06_08070 [Proteobacteria bacterium]|nr:hypothetical protein [Pseudomonadota bacterium]